MTGILAIVLVIAAVVLLILMRKKFFAILMDLAFGTIIYLAFLFLITWVGVRIPIVMAEWGYPVSMVLIMAYHIITNFSHPRGITKPWGAL